MSTSVRGALRGRSLTAPWRVGSLIVAIVAVLALLLATRALVIRMPNETATAQANARAIYLTSSFNGSGWIRIDALTLKDLTSAPLLPIAATGTNSSYTLEPQDGSIVLVADFPPQSAKMTIYDGRTGRPRGQLVLQTKMVIDAMSADGATVIGRIGTTNEPITGAKAVVSVADGHVIRTVPAAVIPGEIDAWPVAPDLSAMYFFTTPTHLSATPDQPLGLQPLSLVVQDTVTGRTSSPIPLPGITAGAVLAFGSPTVAGTPTTYRPGIALSSDGKRLAALSFDGRTLDLIDTRTLEVTTVQVRPKASLLDLLGPRIAFGKTLNDVEMRPIRFTPDGSALLSYAQRTHYDDLGGPVYTTTAMQRIDVASGVITAERQANDEGTYGFQVGADGTSLYVISRSNSGPSKSFVLRRLDAVTLEVRAERALAIYSELHMLAEP